MEKKRETPMAYGKIIYLYGIWKKNKSVPMTYEK